MENINIKDFLFEVDKAILWLTKRRTFPVIQNVGVTKQIVIKEDDKQISCDVLEKLIKEAPDTYVREWLEQQLDKESKARNSDIADISEIDLPIQLQLSSTDQSVNWIEELDRNSNIAVSQAKEIVTQRNIHTFLCPALQTLSNDTFEIAKVTTPILLGLVAGGILVIPLSPMLFAAIAFIIARSGIASFCLGYEKKKSEEK